MIDMSPSRQPTIVTKTWKVRAPLSADGSRSHGRLSPRGPWASDGTDGRPSRCDDPSSFRSAPLLRLVPYMEASVDAAEGQIQSSTSLDSVRLAKINQSNNQSISQSHSQPVSRSINQSINQSINCQPGNQSK